MLAALRGGCLAPVGGWGRVEGADLRLDGVVLSTDGSKRITASQSGQLEDATEIGNIVAQELLELGAAELIADSRQT